MLDGPDTELTAFRRLQQLRRLCNNRRKLGLQLHNERTNNGNLWRASRAHQRTGNAHKRNTGRSGSPSVRFHNQRSRTAMLEEMQPQDIIGSSSERFSRPTLLSTHHTANSLVKASVEPSTTGKKKEQLARVRQMGCSQHLRQLLRPRPSSLTRSKRLSL
jgi:hypothetical protein